MESADPEPRRPAIFLSILLAALTMPAHAGKLAEENGFRGTHFGPADVLNEPPMEGCVRNQVMDNAWLCTTRLGEHEVDVIYVDRYDLFWSVTLLARGSITCNGVKDSLADQWGPPTELKDETYQEWSDGDIRAMWTYEEEVATCRLLMVHVPFFEEIRNRSSWESLQLQHPFGFALGGEVAPYADICRGFDGDNSILVCDGAPTPLGGVESYALGVVGEMVWKVVAFSMKMPNDHEGKKVRYRFDGLTALLSKRYGAPKITDSVRGGARWRDPGAFAKALHKGKRELTAYWMVGDTRITLVAKGYLQGDTSVWLSYEILAPLQGKR